ncbi:Zinc finger CCCH domain-containing protein [Lachnellula occidentalis]|uniref:Zinc finger CCCH domain-containing protein n=1 Tax=Lachnellula occidentalis TaxID=215460 RepID=A0A8H8UFT9_9HELO|nr:Zinc finger CCCH domain-containing protein [Lachnellula occidentalis]
MKVREDLLTPPRHSVFLCYIVKSYNEENVLRCIADVLAKWQKSVWTTQAQNGSVFKEAFESCKSVILVFSITKSKAFQGCARMESLPGSVESPAWQESINWESAGAFKVKWMVVCSIRFQRIGHLKNALNENQAVLIGKDGQEVEEDCGLGLIELVHEEVREALGSWRGSDEKGSWEDFR